jgi:hypothetical protein
VAYRTPLEISGVVSSPPSVPVSQLQARPSVLTFSALIGDPFFGGGFAQSAVVDTLGLLSERDERGDSDQRYKKEFS